MDAISNSMVVGRDRVAHLEQQLSVTRETALRYLAAVHDVAREVAQRELDEAHGRASRASVDLYNFKSEARREERRRDAERHREAYERKHEERDERHDHEKTWRAFVPQFKRNPVDAFASFCLEPADDVQPDDVGDQVGLLFAQLARDHHVARALPDLARELEARGLLVRTGYRKIVMRVAAPRVRGRRPEPPRLDAGRVPVFAVHCRLTDFGRRLVQELMPATGDQEAVLGAV